jgi:hypothetical protein
MAGLASITAVSTSGCRARYALAENSIRGPHIRSRVIEITERDAGRMPAYGQTVATPLAPAVFAEAMADREAALDLLRFRARYDGYEPDEASGETVLATLSCGHMLYVPASAELPDVAECPAHGYEREITSIDRGE